MRYFNEADEQPSEPRSERPSWMPDQPNLFGRHLDRDVLEFLVATGAVLDVDECDMSPEDPSDSDESL